ncbi:MAG: hypothetical protein ACRD2T_15785 [Thermoanaerobaculia bacterium]
MDSDEGDQDRLAMIMTHPCSMRQGPRLVPHLHAVRVRKWERSIPLEGWSSGFYRIMPLPSLFPGRNEANYAAVFDTLGRIRSDQVLHDRRIACLSHDGLALLQQRFVHNLTRVVVPKLQLLEHMAHVLDEAELQEDWTRDLLGDLPETEVAARLQPEIDRFDQFLTTKRENGNSHREDLRNPECRAGVRRAVHAEVRRRKPGGPLLD